MEQILSGSALFRGLTTEEIAEVLAVVQGRTKRAEKGTFVICHGEIQPWMGIVLHGAMHIIQEDVWGNRHILTDIRPGDLFGETFAAMEARPSTVDALAAKETEYVQIYMENMVKGTEHSEPCRRVLRNFFHILAQKNLLLTEKLQYLSQRSIRHKLIAYLAQEGRKQQRAVIQIPYNRQQLADYLSVDRSALSATLSAMQKEGILDFYKNEFKLKQIDIL